MWITLGNSPYVRVVGAEDFGHRMSLLPHHVDQLDAILGALHNSVQITQQGIIAEKKSDLFGDYIDLSLPASKASPYDVIEVLLSSEMISRQDALRLEKPIDELLTKNSTVVTKTKVR